MRTGLYIVFWISVIFFAVLLTGGAIRGYHAYIVIGLLGASGMFIGSLAWILSPGKGRGR